MKHLFRIIYSYKYFIFLFLIFFFLFLSFYPTIFELTHANHLGDTNREFILEHNYYWPDFNLYLSKIRQGWEGRWTALERYTSEPHKGSLIQEFYIVLGHTGKLIGLDPNFSYQLGRIVLSPLLLLITLFMILYFFSDPLWQIISFIIILSSGSFPRFYTDANGALQVGRFMEWWSNIDVLQRITFDPHILLGQVVSFFVLYQFMKNNYKLQKNKFIWLIILGNLTGLVFPPSLITLDCALILVSLFHILKYKDKIISRIIYSRNILFVFFSLPALLYIYLITKISPWSALIDFHRTHPMMIPFSDYILGTGPIFFLGVFGIVLSVIKKDKKFQPLIFWILVTFLFAIFFTHVKEQSPLRFTQTGLFIPLGILGAYFLKELKNIIYKPILFLLILLFISTNLFMMTVSLGWQTTFISQRIGANIPLVPYPPQTMYPLKKWMDGIRWLRDDTNHNDVVLAEVTAGNFIPAYAGNTVYFGQANTVDYDKKGLLVDDFFAGKMSGEEAKSFLNSGRIKYIFFSVQEKEKSENKNLDQLYPFLKPVYSNNLVVIYSYL